MIGWILGGLLLGAAATAAICFFISHLSRSSVKDSVEDRASSNVVKVVVKDIAKDPNVNHVKLNALDDDGNIVEEYDISGDTIDNSLYRGQEIYIY